MRFANMPLVRNRVGLNNLTIQLSTTVQHRSIVVIDKVYNTREKEWHCKGIGEMGRIIQTVRKEAEIVLKKIWKLFTL